MPRASMIRAMPDRPAPPMPTKCTGPSSSAGSSTSGTGTFTGRLLAGGGSWGVRRPQHQVGELLVGVERDHAARRGATSPRGGRGRSAGRAAWRATHSGVSAASETSSPPPASTTGRAFSACSPLPIGSGTKTAGRPDPGDLGDRVRAGAADHRVGGGVREVHPVDVRLDDVRRAARRALGRGLAGLGPTMCSTWTPAAASAGAAAATDWLSRRAPWEPPVTSSVGRSGSRPKLGAGLGPQRGPVEGAIIRRIGSPVQGVRQVGAGEAGGDVRGEPGAELVGDARAARCPRAPPAGACGGGRRGTPAPRRSRRSRPPRRAAPGRSPRASLTEVAQPARRAQQVGVQPARQRHRRDQLERVARRRDHPGLQPAGRAQGDDLDVGGQPAQRVGGGEQRRGVPGGATTGEQDPRRRAPTPRRSRPSTAPRGRGSCAGRAGAGRAGAGGAGATGARAPGRTALGAAERDRRRSCSAAAASGSGRANPTSRPSATSEGTSAEPP